MIHPILFILLAAVAVAAALGMLLSRNAVHSALYLVLNFMTVAVLYLVLNAPFIAMVQITVYAGAIVILFLFVIMLLGAEKLRGAADEVRGSERYHRYAAVLLAVVLIGVFGYLLFQNSLGSTALSPSIDAGPQALGIALFQSYVFPFQVTGVLLLAAVTGVVIFGHTKKRGKDNA
ncbi:MAG TPA: NADH-quinone oxidoreductase subunit J [Promineifilum sp.]|nr:NADH-quinone oxidoreductase subunit J [Promineifilum sp.]HRO23072.1 NADH-quinone oxidoreductase subunit J [Promineifilum sp.]HRO89363.1 NADH-quinone oxidoreductase subunit J [Promineifilum sp.]HRQ13616.1 NADH-quinone oxidoreductase subunit J [Promineifilum sp.]